MNPKFKLVTSSAKYALPAFTLMELMVSMAITAILVTAVFYGYRLLQSQYTQFSTISEQAIDHQHFATLLRWETYKQEYLERQGNELIFYGLDEQQVVYTFSQGFISRHWVPEQEIRDTFFIDAFIQQTILANNQVLEGLIDEVDIGIRNFGPEHVITINKFYSATDLMKYQSRNEH